MTTKISTPGCRLRELRPYCIGSKFCLSHKHMITAETYPCVNCFNMRKVNFEKKILHFPLRNFRLNSQITCCCCTQPIKPAWQAVEREKSKNERGREKRSSRVRSSRASRARLSSFLPLRTPATQATTDMVTTTKSNLCSIIGQAKSGRLRPGDLKQENFKLFRLHCKL